MKLIDIFTESIRLSDNLIKLHNSILSKNIRSARTGWIQKIFENKVVAWPTRDSLWRVSNKELLIIGKFHNSSVQESFFKSDFLNVLLRASSVLAMAAVDKILHEAVLYRFGKLVKESELDKLVHMRISESYQISIDARIRKGKGGSRLARPGHKIKAIVMDKLYEKTFLSTQKLEQICSMCDKKSIFTLYKEKKHLTETADELRKQWGRLYSRRNSIAHETDIIRKQKGKRIHFNKVKTISDDIKFIKNFGVFLSNELDV